MNTATPMKDVAKWIAGLCSHRLIKDTTIRPIRPMTIKEPIDVKSLLVVYPYKLIEPNTAEQIKKVRTNDWPVYIRPRDDRDIPISAA